MERDESMLPLELLLVSGNPSLLLIELVALLRPRGLLPLDALFDVPLVDALIFIVYSDAMDLLMMSSC